MLDETECVNGGELILWTRGSVWKFCRIDALLSFFLLILQIHLCLLLTICALH